MIVALAGRRIDKMGTVKPSFPLSRAEATKQKIADFFKASKASILVCSGANGADLLALEVAGELGIERYMVLPFGPSYFKKRSVVDRPGSWGEIFDSIYDGLEKEKRNIDLGSGVDDELAYKKTNIAILDRADRVAIAGNPEKTAVIVWDGKAKSTDDATEHFKEEAIKRNYKIKEINTLA
jgi:hypothetical protein